MQEEGGIQGPGLDDHEFILHEHFDTNVKPEQSHIEYYEHPNINFCINLTANSP